MLVLAIDTAGSACSACVWQDGMRRAFAEEKMERGQDQRLIPLILDVMKKADIDFAQLDRIGITRGPGSFTGLRIGLAAARGLGLASGKPVIGIDRFSIYRQPISAHSDVMVVIQSKRAELFCRFYPADGNAAEPAMMTLDDIVAFEQTHAGLIVTGDVDSLPGFQAPSQPDVIICAELAAAAKATDPFYVPRPLYLRPPDVTIKTTDIVTQS